MVGIRGAVFLDANTESEIKAKAGALYKAVLEQNGISEEDIISLTISLTDDITRKNPASCLREAGLACSVPLFCVQEARIDSGAPMCMRFLVLCGKDIKTHHVYLDEAQRLRQP